MQSRPRQSPSIDDMTWVQHHRTSEAYASKAEARVRLGKHEDARALYALAAAAEGRALEENVTGINARRDEPRLFP